MPILIGANVESLVELRFLLIEFVVWYFIDNCSFSILLAKDNFKNPRVSHAGFSKSFLGNFFSDCQ